MSPQAGYLLVHEIAPRLAVTIPQCVKLVGSEDVEEVTQDAIAMAARMLDSVEKSGKQNVKPSHIAYYALQHIKSGRRSVGNSVVDVMATGTQLQGKSSLMSLEEIEMRNPDDELSNFALGEMLSRDAEDPSTVGARAVDWERFLNTQDDRSRAIVKLAAEGHKMAAVSRKCGISFYTVDQSRKKLANELREFFGENILAEIARVPGWKSSLMALRERHARPER